MSLDKEYQEFLAEHCNRLKYGRCSNTGCLERGGHQRSQDVNHNKATCVPFEIAQGLEFLERLERNLSLMLTER